MLDLAVHFGQGLIQIKDIITRNIWAEMERAISKVLESTTLQDLVLQV